MNEETKERDFLKSYRALFRELKNADNSNCPPAEQLQRYVNGELSRREARAMEDHLNTCSFCQTALQRLKAQEMEEARAMETEQDWAEIEKDLDEKFYTSLKSANFGTPQKETLPGNWSHLIYRKWRDLRTFLTPPRVLAVAGSLVLVFFLGLYSVAYLSRPAYFNLAEIYQEKPVVLRSQAASSPLTKGLLFFGQKNYGESIAKLMPYLDAHPDNYSAAYYLGLSYLLDARKGLPGMAYGFKKSEVKQGIDYLQKALALSGKNNFYREDCHWYLGKAFLMLGDKTQAIRNFTAITALQPSNLMRKQAAQKMIFKLK